MNDPARNIVTAAELCGFTLTNYDDHNDDLGTTTLSLLTPDYSTLVIEIAEDGAVEYAMLNGEYVRSPSPILTEQAASNFLWSCQK
jgi:hypothetical protein